MPRLQRPQGAKATKPWESPLALATATPRAQANSTGEAMSAAEADHLAAALQASLQDGGSGSGSAAAGGGGGGESGDGDVCVVDTTPPAAPTLMPLALITPADAAVLAQLYGAAADAGGEDAAVPAFGRLVTVSPPTGHAGDGVPPTPPELEFTSPAARVCAPCCAAAVDAAQAAACVYSNATLVVTHTKPPRHMAAAGGPDASDSSDSDAGSEDDKDGGAGKKRKPGGDDAQRRGGGGVGAEAAALQWGIVNPFVTAAVAAALRASAAASGTALPGAGMRASRRVRGGGGGQGGATAGRRVISGVSSTHTVWSLKLRILEFFQVHPLDQLLFYGGQRLDVGDKDGDKERTLGGQGVPSGGAVFFVSTGKHDADDVADILDDDLPPGFTVPGGGRSSAPERGFKGTALVSSGAKHTGPTPGSPNNGAVIVLN
jgi:hypothetical protein